MTDRELRERYPEPGASSQVQRDWLMLLATPAAAPQMAELYRGAGRTEVEAHARSLSAACEGHYLHIVARWFLRRYALVEAARLYWRMVRSQKTCCPRPLMLGELLMLRLIMSVALGMLVICGTGPWEVFRSLEGEKRLWFVTACVAAAWGYRALDAVKQCGRLWRGAVRAAALTAWGWALGWLALKAYVRWFWPAAEAVTDVLPAAGLAVGVVVQDIWEDRPASEPV